MGVRIQKIQEYYRQIAPYMDRELSGRGDETFWKKIVCRPEFSTALELGCGTGRITRILAPSLRLLVALDLSPDMIRLSAEKTAELSNVHLILADMRQLPFRSRFDAVIAADDPFVHLTRDEERNRALRQSADHLSQDGSFLLDTFWLPPGKLQRARESIYEKERRAGGSGPEPLRIEEEWDCEPDRPLCRATYRYRIGSREVLESQFEGRFWTREEIIESFSDAGLIPVRFYGGYDGSPWDPEQSDRLIVEARKRGRKP